MVRGDLSLVGARRGVSYGSYCGSGDWTVESTLGESAHGSCMTICRGFVDTRNGVCPTACSVVAIGSGLN